MGLRRTIEPAEAPLSTAEAKKQCEIPDSMTAHDLQLDRMIATAVADIERYTRRALITQTWQLTLRQFPFDAEQRYQSAHAIVLPRPPLQSITSVGYVDSDGATQTFSSSLYNVVTGSNPGWLEPVFGEVWPVTRTETPEAVTVTYVAGFGDASAVPDIYKQLIAELVAFRFMNRGDHITPQPTAWSRLPNHIRWSLDSLRCGMVLGAYGVKG